MTWTPLWECLEGCLTQNLGTSWNFSVKGFRRYTPLKLTIFQKTAISAYFGHPEIPRPNFHVPVLATASPGIDLVNSLAFRVSLQQFLTKKMKKNGQKMAKNDQKMAIIWQFFNFFQKILVLMPPKLLSIFWPFVPTYSQSSSHLETISSQKMAIKWPKMTCKIWNHVMPM